MNKLLTQEQLKELVSSTSDKLELEYPSIIEKDYYVTRLICSLSGIENENFRLIFAGGTCLSKAHKIVNRMSEDIDFKIQLKNPGENFTNSHLIKELKNFRGQIKSSLTFPDLTVVNTSTRNGGKYIQAELNYPALFASSDILRPHLLLEFTLSDIRLPVESLVIKTIIEDVIEINPIFSTSTICCSSVEETAMEKWVGLTRRITAIERQYHDDDPTLVRHIYDINAISHANRIGDRFYNLAKAIVNYDASQFKNQHPEYGNDPSAEISQSLDILKNKKLWKERYQKFIDRMVYDKAATPSYDSVMQSLESLSSKVLNSL